MTFSEKKHNKVKHCTDAAEVRKNLLLAVFVFCILLYGCGNKNAADETAASETSVTELPQTSPPEKSTAEEITVFSEQDTEPETLTEAAVPEETAPVDDETPPEEGMVRSPLTNLWTTAELAGKRPLAVMYPTDKKAQPQYGLDRAEIFYEIMEEGSMSRQMAIMTDWSGLDRIGNIRSTRDYFIISSMEWDSILVHFGGPEIFVKDLLNREDVDNINGVGGVMGSDYGAFFRIPAGSRSEHTAYTDSEHLEAALQKAGFAAGFRENYWNKKRWLFSPASKPVDLALRPGCVEATSIDMSGCYPITKSAFRYDAEDGLYYRSIYGEPQKDALSGNQMAFTNILIESCTWGERGAGYLYFHVLDEGHTGYYLTGGKMIPCTWSKTGEYDVTRFYDLNGNEIIMNTGKTMICIARDCDSFLADGTTYQF